MITLVPREFHLFQAAGRDFLYLVPSAAVFALNEPTSAVLNVVTSGPTTTDRTVELLGDRFDAATIAAAIGELLDVRAIGYYCEWIRGWTDTCLKIYGELAERNPAFLERFDRDEAKAEAAI